jgi:Arc/MetJ-type ribon-helix-helix transcriptional regulator
MCVCYIRPMRLHITLRDELVRELDRRVGARRRSSFIRRAVEQALDDERRWDLIESSLDSVADEGHEWDTDVAAWVQAQRRLDDRRIG